MKPNKARVLICVDWFVPGYKAGGPIQSCKNLVLALRNHIDFYILTSNLDWGETEPYKDIESDTWLKFDGDIPIYYASKGALGLKKLNAIIEEVQPDFLYLNSMFSVNYTILPLILRWQGKLNQRVILAPRGMLQPGALSLKPLKKNVYLKLFNWMGLSRMIEFHTTDNIEANRVKKVFPSHGPIHIIGNFPEQENIPVKQTIKIPGELKLVYASRISREKNLHLVLEVLNEKPYSGTIELFIAGHVNDEDYYLECKNLVEKLPSNIHVKFTGSIPHEQLLRWMQDFHFFILPTFGENFGHSIFEALLAGRPVIISDRTLWRSLNEKKAGWDLTINNKNPWFEVIETALNMNQEAFDEMSEKSRNFALNFRTLNANHAEYLELFKKTTTTS